MINGSDVQFRQAVASDIPAMSAIRLGVRENVLSNPAKVTQQMYEDYLDLFGRGWVAEVDGVIAGFSYADKRDGSIWALFIEARHEGRGIGKELLRLACDWLFRQGHDHVQLSTSAGTRADRFYASQGWQRTALNANDAGFRLARPGTGQDQG